ncbi:PP2C family protein-serine/threonine phosphatase [Streptomyces venezuelae]|uniref:PP2C family protein-serine/threonine phosphatase n=1 Tax=Streptomyces venezuelae TaxID=54571 RepID=UPI001CC265E1|nr:PP2C family protein-serine/threonine phosphatase [Streptomyces venezuelae]
MTRDGEMPRVRRVCVLAWTGAAVSWELTSPGVLGASLASCAAFLLLATACALHIRQRLLAELRRTQEIAGAAQRALLRPLPPRIEGLALAAVHGAAVGGDLYDALPTRYGVRVVIGDVRGHGLPALGAAAAVLGAFREAAYDEHTLAGVLRRMERALGRHLRDRAKAEHPAAGGSSPRRGQGEGEPEAPVAEEFVTVLLLEIGRDGRLTALNCGHPWPYVLPSAVPAGSGLGPGPGPLRGAFPLPAPSRNRGSAPDPVGRPGSARHPGTGAVSLRRRPERLCRSEPLPPLGVLPLPAGLAARDCGQLRPGEGLFLHTDGAEDARDRTGRCFPLRGALAEAAAGTTPARLVAGVHAALLRHTSGRPADDIALLVLRNDRFRHAGHRP